MDWGIKIMVSNAGQCSCEGNNPNCFRCSGTGMVQLQDTNQPHSETYIIGQLLSSLPIKPKKIFPELLVRQKNVKKTAIKVEKSPKKSRKNLKPATKSPYKNAKNFRAPEVHIKPKNMECPVCCTYITKTHFSFLNHLKTHDTADNIKHKNLIDRTFQRISETQSDIHLTPPRMNIFSNNNASTPLIAPKGKKQKPIVSLYSSSKLNPPTEPPSSRSSVIEDNYKKLDSTYGKHTIRDGGKFGSHPSHDNFDDESGA